MSPRQSGTDGGLSLGKRSRRSTSDISSVAKEGKRWSFATAFTSSKRPANSDANSFPGGIPSFADPLVANNLRQLQKYTLKIKGAARNIGHVDSAWDEYIKHRERCLECCKSLMNPQPPRRESSVVSPTTLTPPKSEHQRDLSLDTLNLVPVETGSSTQSSSSRVGSSLRLSGSGDQCQQATREWQTTVELLASALRTSLQETYNAYDKDATPEGFERICTDKAARHNTIYHMRNASISKMMSADLDFFPKYDVRFRNYDEIKKDLVKLQSLLGTSGIPQSRTIIERCISPTGDVMLEFANTESEELPVLRFRVASHCLRETSSPIFGHMFNAHIRAGLDHDIRRSLPLPPSKHVCADGNEVMLYRMPQTELNTQRSLEILLHAAHNHNDRVPRDVPFTQFVAIAEACLRYRCTSPLELAVEHLWLPYWRDTATDDMLGEVLLICYVFGLSENFTHLSRIAILGMAGPCHSWPHTVEKKIAAVRRAKIEQIYEQCRITMNEYLCPTPHTRPTPSTDSDDANAPRGLRCPRGDRSCDAQNLGWYMKTLTELGMLPAVLQSQAFSHNQAAQTQSLWEMVNALCLVTSPPQNHGGICDFAPAFRAAIRDIYESISGLTLYEVSGKHGWALSKNRSPRQSGAQNNNQNQNHNGGGMYEQLFKIAAPQRYAPGDHHGHYHHHHYGGSTALLRRVSSAVDEGCGRDRHDDDDVCFFKILSLLDNPQDLRAAAAINRGFYRSYLRNKTRLWEGIRGVGLGRDIVEAEGTPYRGANVPGGDDNGSVAPGAVRPQEKFRHGQILVVEGKRLVESDANKYPGGMRERLVGLRVKHSEKSGQGSGLMR
ncbi:hypothetical protein F5Y01DRAFT_279112 [Xylaria sp. FL0043]|nr:hypothetical protein F5Y01DRAFT_279112 [Xylaria sp. FL0043]